MANSADPDQMPQNCKGLSVPILRDMMVTDCEVIRYDYGRPTIFRLNVSINKLGLEKFHHVLGSDPIYLIWIPMLPSIFIVKNWGIWGYGLTHCRLNRLSDTIYWKHPISILGTSGYEIYIFLKKNG